jgi:UDP-N-acetylglucosamine--N-acetylmuramyl-(pentapeptide) pyrophosphoryl-undecaprenol N-acetylglucosamine transferase
MSERGAEVVFAGAGLAKNPFFSHGTHRCFDIPAPRLGKGVAGALSFPGAFIRSTAKALSLLLAERPDAVVGFGSFHTAPLLAGALLLRIPYMLFEANSLLGKANRLFAPFARYTAHQFPLRDPPRRGVLVPLLPWEGEAPWPREEALQFFGLPSNRPTLLVMGGSQGASFLNRIAPLAIPDGWQAIHLAGSIEAKEAVEAAYRQRGVQAEVRVFEKKMAAAYSAADGALCRAGAATLGEIIRFGVPPLFVPFPHAADGHQLFNAQMALREIGVGRIIEEKEASPAALCAAIGELTREGDARAKMGAYRQRAEGRRKIAELVEEVCRWR